MNNEFPPIPPDDLTPPPPPDDDDTPSRPNRPVQPADDDTPTSGTPTLPADEDEAFATPRRERERKSGGARDRYERRKQQGGTPKAPVAPRQRQIRTPQEFRLPQFKIPRSRALLPVIGIIGAVVFVVLIVVVLGSLRNTTPERQPNALWLTTEWTYETHTDEEVAELVRQLRERKIGTIYAWVSYLQFDRTWRAQDQFDEIRAFVAQFKEAYPEALLLGWVSLPTTESDGVTTRINDVNVQQEVAAFSSRVVDEFGFDGIFLNAEPVWDGDQNFLALVRAVRGEVGIDVPISAAIPPDWSPSNSTIPLPPLIEPGTEWATPYKQSVALLVDQMAVMAYQSGLSSADDYAQWVAYQVRTFALAIADLGTQTSLIIGIPTFDAEPPGHDPLVENITSAVRGIDLGLTQAGDAASYVQGVSVYADFTTSEDEWASYQREWADR